MSELAPLRAGDVFAGFYEVERRLKSGGMGAVYLVRHTETGRRHALKVMHPSIVSDTSARSRFKQEAQVAALIDDPRHIVDVVHAGVDSATGYPFIVMELLVGKELGEMIAEHGRLGEGEALDYLAQTARALQRAHSKGVVHRDLKPENLFVVMREGEPRCVKILDFGIAKILAGASMSGTLAGGTPLYMAPEQTEKGSRISAATDIWAFGLIAYTLLVGKPYWEADALAQLYADILSRPFESARVRALRHGVELPAEFDSFFFGCVAREPSQRFASATAAMSALSHVFGTSVVSASSMPSGTHPVSHETPRAFAAHPSSTPLANTTGTPISTEHDDTGTLAHVPKTRLPLVAVLAAVPIVGLAVYVGITWSSKREVPSAAPPVVSSASEPAPAAAAAAVLAKNKFRERVDRLNPFVDLGAYRMHQHEVTHTEYALYLQTLTAKERIKAAPLAGFTEPVSEAFERRPITWVTYEMATAYCAAIDAALPSSVEWGVAVGSKYPWGDDWPKSLAGIAVGLGDKATPFDVTSSPADHTASGIFDLGGNVQEWTSSVSDGAATVRGASVSMSASEAQRAIVEGRSKFTATTAGPKAKTEMVAGAQLGFRCVRRTP